MQTIDLYMTIEKMRELTKQSRTFSFSFMSYNREKQTSEGVKHVHKATLRPAATKDEIAHADLKLFYMDKSVNEPRNCWQPLLMTFNDFKVKLS